MSEDTDPSETDRSETAQPTADTTDTMPTDESPDPDTDDADTADSETVGDIETADDTETRDSTESTSTRETTGESEPAQDGPSRSERYIRYALLAGLTLLGLVAILRFYFAASNAITVWVTAEYRSIFQALFNLVILMIVGIGISWQVRKLR